MITIKEEFTVKHFNIREDFKDFPEEFESYIKIFRITMCIDFEIQLKDMYLNSLSVKSKITKYLKSKYMNINITFTEKQLPF